MKFKITLIALLLSTSLYTKAQSYVTIPDAHFVAWLDSVYPACMNGNQMDTTCYDIINTFSVDVSHKNIADLTGIEYFTNLLMLFCYNNNLTNLPILPHNLQTLECDYNQLISLPSLPNSLEDLRCMQNHLINLPPLPNPIKYLRISYNQLTSLPALPDSLQYLECDDNQLTSLPALPNLLLNLWCFNNLLTSLPALPDSLQFLQCSYNQIANLPSLPNSMLELVCIDNLLTSLPALPDSLQYLDCFDNHLTSLPVLPNFLKELRCYSNQLTILPALPNTLLNVNCHNNMLTTLPVLPNSLLRLFCENNQLINLPALPDSLKILFCPNNQLLSLPALPNSLEVLFCSNNNISCFPIFPNSIHPSISCFSISANFFTCLPNYISAMDSATLTYPLCMLGDSINNPNGCASTNGITGYTYKDNNANCLKDSGDLSFVNIPLKLYNNNNNLLAQIYSLSNGIYNFLQPVGTYIVIIDTTGMPFTAQCLNPGIDSLVTTTSVHPLATDVNFSLTCKQGFDVGVQSVVANGWVFPGQQHALKIVAGDLSHWYNLNCGAGVSGQIVVTVAGPVTYFGPTPGALTPSVSGNVFTYNIADFSNVNNMKDFGLNFTTNTTAQLDDTICVNVIVTPTSGDNNVTNNNYQYCYSVLNSLDPNMKEVYPVNVLPGYEGYFTYTIHFQNTGTAPANNIFLIDTLSNNLDLGTFKVINYSHNNIASLTGNVLTFRFPNIMLPDSTTDEPASKGFVQYKIKPKGALAAGAQIKNTGYIYFDYNAPIATNTTTNIFSPLSIKEHSASFQMTLYPNPVLDYATLIFTTNKTQQIQIKVLDMLGQELLQSNKQVNSGTNTIQINTQALAKGFYVLSVSDGCNEVRTVRFVK